MKAKSVLFFIGLLFFLFDTEAQYVTVNLSLQWKEDVCQWDVDTFSHSPFLLATYTNQSNRIIYFQNYTPVNCGIPYVVKSPLAHHKRSFPWSYSSCNYSLDRVPGPKIVSAIPTYSGKSFHVDVLGRNLSVLSQDCYNRLNCGDTVSSEERYYIDSLSDYLFLIYSYKRNLCCDQDFYYRPRRYHNLDEKTSQYQQEDWQQIVKSDVLPDSWCIDIEKEIIFLRPGESYTCYFNLVGLRRLGGKYSIVFVGNHPLDTPPQIVFGGNTIELPEFLTKLPKRFDRRRIYLYERYDDRFVSDTLIVDFDKNTVDIRKVRR